MYLVCFESTSCRREDYEAVEAVRKRLVIEARERTKEATARVEVISREFARLKEQRAMCTKVSPVSARACSCDLAVSLGCETLCNCVRSEARYHGSLCSPSQGVIELHTMLVGPPAAEDDTGAVNPTADLATVQNVVVRLQCDFAALQASLGRGGARGPRCRSMSMRGAPTRVCVGLGSPPVVADGAAGFKEGKDGCMVQMPRPEDESGSPSYSAAWTIGPDSRAFPPMMRIEAPQFDRPHMLSMEATREVGLNDHDGDEATKPLYHSDLRFVAALLDRAWRPRGARRA